MATGPKKGLWVAKKVGSGPDNGGFDTYEVASGYGTALFTGDPVKLNAGKVEKASNGDSAIGVFIGCSYIDANGTPQEKPYKPASLTPPEGVIYAKVMNEPLRTYECLANGTVAQVAVGNIYAANLDAGNTMFGLSGLTIDVVPSQVGTTALPSTGSATIVGNVSGTANNDTFTVKAASNTGAATTITILTATTRDQLMAALNAVPNVKATLTSDYKIVLETTDGTSLVVADGTGTPLADSSILAAGTSTATVAANAGMVRVQKVVDPINRVLEVTLVNQANL